jgi:hypothetical protein
MDISLGLIKNSLSNFIRRFHVTIFVILVIGGLVVVVLLLNNVIIRSSEQGDYVPPSSAPSSFDETTIDKIEQLKSRTDASTPLDLSKGRINPFVE